MDKARPLTKTSIAPANPSAVAQVRPVRRPRSRRWRTFRSVSAFLFLAVLLGLTAWNATHSPALDRSVAAESKGDYVGALQSALEHLEQRPWSRQARLIAGRCLSRLDFAERAEEYYQTAGRLSTEDLHYRAYGLVRANLRDQALTFYHEILAANPRDVAALRLEGGILLSQNRWETALEVADQLINGPEGVVDLLNPATVRTPWTLRKGTVGSVPTLGYTLKAVVHHDRQEYGDAANSFEKVLELDPSLASMPLDRNQFWAHFCEDLIKDGRSAVAVEHLKSWAESTSDPGLIDILGRAYQQESLFNDAERCWQRVLQLDAKHFTAYLNLGRLSIVRRQYPEAVQLLSRAVELQPGSYEATYSLGLAYRQGGNVPEALIYEEKAAQIIQPAPKDER